MGEDFYPGTFDERVVDRWITVNDRDAYSMARRIAREEGMLVGSSTGTAMHAAMELAAELDEDAVVVVIFCDTGRGYISKLYNDAWLRENDLLDATSGDDAAVSASARTDTGSVGPG
ncbi:MAG: pyridoxal-phosphate dependent enzyme [Chloroflexia bacterium]